MTLKKMRRIEMLPECSVIEFARFFVRRFSIVGDLPRLSTSKTTPLAAHSPPIALPCSH